MNGKVSDATVWATDLKSYPVEVEQNTGDILANPNRIDADNTQDL
jgi:hypothetical protein